MGPMPLNMVEGGKQDPMAINIAYQEKNPWKSPQTTTLNP
jgi:hypothetical protein